MMRRASTFLALGLALVSTHFAEGPEVRLPNQSGSLRFAVIGDTGTGGRAQTEIAGQMEAYRKVFPFEFAVMVGDNMYGGESPQDFARKFEQPYQSMLSQGVKFYAALGNHDNPNQANYKQFNMNGRRYYSFRPKDSVRFFALDTNYPSKEQLEWLEKELAASKSEWKIAFFHHPLYSSGEKHGPSEQLRAVLEPLFVRHGVSVVLAGHEHFYERIVPQKGITHFIVGSSAKLRRGDIRKTDITAKGFDADNVFMLCEINGDQFHFQTVSRAGKTIDGGTIERLKTQTSAARALNLTPSLGLGTAGSGYSYQDRPSPSRENPQTIFF